MVDILTIAVVIVVILVLVPVIQQTAARVRRMRLIRDLEVKRGSRVIALIHRQERMVVLGIPVFRYIDVRDSEEILRAIRLTPDDMPIDLIVHTPGGMALSASQIAMALKRHKAKVTVFVPHYAMSGGTLLCLTADEVFMDDNAVLGPVDPRIEEYPAASLLRIPILKDMGDIDDRTLILADVAAKAQTQMRDFVTTALSDTLGGEKAKEIAALLTGGRWTHDYPITVEEAQNLGLPVSRGLPKEIYRLMDLFPQAMPRRPSVEYIPVPYRKGEREKRKRKEE
ncbi:SDH family Clp fold serine proteinase [Methanoculleus sp.]|uniref:SDH family Clp fold serine proteinase n=1 Tax=Methanoculleus sp. TaxID=90427 RepID=UPI00272E12F5|nr:ATP-dependent Clp protease proteolytic subunit [Methanoculleus sp.]